MRQRFHFPRRWVAGIFSLPDVIFLAASARISRRDRIERTEGLHLYAVSLWETETGTLRALHARLAYTYVFYRAMQFAEGA